MGVWKIVAGRGHRPPCGDSNHYSDGYAVTSGGWNALTFFVEGVSKDPESVPFVG